jgi:hypothetical protein
MNARCRIELVSVRSGFNVARDVVEALRIYTHGEGKDWFAFDSMNGPSRRK